MSTIRWTFAALFALTLGACGDTATAPSPPATTSTGESPTATSPAATTASDDRSVQIAGEFDRTPPADARLLLIWAVPTHDYVFRHGELRIDGNAFSGPVSMPPADALDEGRFGVGLLVLTEDDLPEGRLAEDADFESTVSIRGASESHVVVFRADATSGSTMLPWSDRFDIGISCGVVAPPIEGDFFATFEPTDCRHLEVTVTESPVSPNWF